MISRNSGIVRYSPNSEEDDDDDGPHLPLNIPSLNLPLDQPLDFSKKARDIFSSHQRNVSTNAIKSETQHVSDQRQHQTHHTQHSQQHRQRSSHSPSTSSTASNRFSTPSPPNDRQTNPVLCQILTGNLIATTSGKVVKNRHSAHTPLSIPMDKRSPYMSSSHIHAMSAALENSSLSPSGSASPIGLGPLNQVDVHYIQPPNAGVGVDRFGTSGGLLTTNSNASANAAVMATGVIAGNNDNKRASKYSSRPFKDYPKNALSMPMLHPIHTMPHIPHMQMPITAEALHYTHMAHNDYIEFRSQMMQSRKSEVRRNSGSNDRKQQSVSNSNGNNGSNGLSTSISGENQSPQSQHNQNVFSGSNVTPHKIMYSEDISQFSNGNSSGNSSTCDGDGVSNASTASQSQTQSMRKRGQPLPEDAKDDAYWERRRKNNEAAKRSRDARRAKEDEIAIRAAFLEQENMRLRCEVAQLKNAKTVFYN